MRAALPRSAVGQRVKHLNPRQGITTKQTCVLSLLRRDCRVKHLNPRQGITTTSRTAPRAQRSARRVKHLNPRQGITTDGTRSARSSHACRVKHLNPRQGITTRKSHTSSPTPATPPCETPKSPPGDYNYNVSAVRRFAPRRV